jgi:DNA replication protein DnaC
MKSQIPPDVALLKGLNVSSIEHTFDKFTRNQGNAEMADTFKRIAEGNRDTRFVLVYGTTGNGKTWICEALIIALHEKGILCRYSSVPRILRDLRDCMDKDSKITQKDMFQGLVDRKILILDDFGMGMKESSWELSTIEDLIGERYHRRFWGKSAITVLTTNQDIKSIPDRITSRFFDPEVGVVICNRDGDHRKRKSA